MRKHIVYNKLSDKPIINLVYQRVEVEVWDIFKSHHYLTENINTSCKCFIAYWNDVIVGFVGILNSPRKNSVNSVSISRLVVLPDFQGLGIGFMMANDISSILVGIGLTVYIKTINDSIGKSFEKHPNLWRPTSHNGKYRTDIDTSKELNYKNRFARKSYCYQYIGLAKNGFENILRPIKQRRLIEFDKNNPSLFPLHIE